MIYNKKHVKHITIVTCFILIISAAFAIDWPSDSRTIMHNFGWNDAGNPALFHSFASEGSIRSIDSGEILFIQDNSNASSNFTSPLGSWMAIEQGDGLIGIYSRFESRENQFISNIVEQGAILAFSGSSGWSDRNGFSFTFYDSKEKRWVNASMILPILRDTRAPQIRQLRLVGQDGRIINPAVQRIVPQGQYKILVDAFDTILNANESPLAVHRMSCLINGVESGVLNMETFSGQHGNLMAYQKVPVSARQAYASFPFYELGNVLLNRGQVVLEIIASDIANNSRNAVFRLTVQ
jgi:hypothetical protein